MCCKGKQNCNCINTVFCIQVINTLNNFEKKKSTNKMYHFYQPVRPTSNLYLQKLIDDNNYYKHLRKLYEIKSGHAYKPQYTENAVEYTHIKNSGRLKSIKKHEIEQAEDNRLKSLISGTKKRVDDRYEYEPKSLMQVKRKTDQMRQSEENANLFNRIVNVKPVVSKLNHGKEWDKQKYYANIATKYPENWKSLVAKENTFIKKELEKVKTVSSQKLPKIILKSSVSMKEKKKEDENKLPVLVV